MLVKHMFQLLVFRLCYGDLYSGKGERLERFSYEMLITESCRDCWSDVLPSIDKPKISWENFQVT